MASHLSINKQFWAKDNGAKGVEIHDLSKPYHEIVATLPKMDNRAIVEQLEKFVLERNTRPVPIAPNPTN